MGNSRKEAIHAAMMAVTQETLNDLINQMETIRSSVIEDQEESQSEFYESNNEMLMNDRRDLEGRAEVIRRDLTTLDQMGTEMQHDSVQVGSVVLTDQRNFYVSISRNCEVDGVEYIGISTSAPIYEVLEGKKAGDRFEFADQHYTISEVF